jgi:peptidyl-prolyl cis-trans isomerase NIMA-interacting 1
VRSWRPLPAHLGLAASLLLAACDDKPPPAPAATSATASATSAAPTATPAPAASSSPPPAASPAASAKPRDWIIVQHVLVSYKGVKRAKSGITRSKAEARELAQKLREQALKPDEDFTELVKKHSDDPAAIERLGSTGKMRRGDMTKTFEDAAFKLNLDEISPVVETPFGFHIIKRNQ